MADLTMSENHHPRGTPAETRGADSTEEGRIVCGEKYQLTMAGLEDVSEYCLPYYRQFMPYSWTRSDSSEIDPLMSTAQYVHIH